MPCSDESAAFFECDVIEHLDPGIFGVPGELQVVTEEARQELIHPNKA